MATFDVKNSNGRFTLRLTVTETATSVANNTSTLSYSLKLIANTSYHFIDYQIGYTVKLNGKTVASLAKSNSDYLELESYGTLTLCNGTYTVTHGDDGSLEDMPVAFSISMTAVDYTPGSLSGSGTMDLTTIPRASSIGAAAANIGEVSTIVVTRKSSTFTHSIAYEFGSLTGYITADGGTAAAETKISATTIAFTVPASFYGQIPNAKSGVCTLTIKTYSGSTQVGGAQTAKFTATAAPSACAPAISATAKDTNAAAIALTGSASKILKGISDVLVESTATAKNSATIESVSVVCGSVTQNGTSVTFEAAESDTIKVTAKDSRGYSTTVTISGLSLIEYFKPTVAVSVQRESQTSDMVQISVVGKWFDGSLGAVNNALTATMQYMKTTDSSYSTAQSMALTTSGETFTGSMEVSGLDYQTEYYFRFYISDKVYVSGGTENSIRVIVKLPKGVPVADWGENDFTFNVPVYLAGDMELAGYIVNGQGALYLYGKNAVGLYPKLDGEVYGLEMLVSSATSIALRPTRTAAAVVTLGQDGRRFATAYFTTAINVTSDRNQKADIQSVGDKYAALFERLEPVSYKLIGENHDRTHLGFISQDVKAVMDEVGLTDLDFGGYCRDIKLDPETGEPILDENGEPVYSYSLRYEEFIPLNTKMIQLQQERIKKLGSDLQALTEKVAQIIGEE